MATQAIPDPSALRSWEEAFQYPLPTVRKLSNRLRKDIDDHHARLRSLVGSSYRDLLGTAERIIEMDNQIQTVDSNLGEIGRRCNTRILERKDANHTALESFLGQKKGLNTQLGSMAQSKVLLAALNVVRRLVKTRGDALQAAKLMVLARLLYKNISETSEGQLILEQHRKSIASLRRKLLAYIDRSLARVDITKDELTKTLSAYALLTSSTLRDVLRQLLAVRLAQLEILASSRTSEAIVKMLDLYTATVLCVQALFPRQVPDALSGLSTVPLLSDSQVKQVQELGLDVYGRWIADDIKTFTSWVRQDPLSASEGVIAMSEFASQARATLLRGLKECLSGIPDSGAILEVRKKVIGAYLSLGAKIKSAGFAQEVAELEDAFLLRLEQLAEKATSLEGFVFDGPGAADGFRGSDGTRQSIWSLAVGEKDLSSGALKFRSSILRRRNGHDEIVVRTITPLSLWVSRIESFWQSLSVMRGTKWDEHLDVDLDDEDESVEEPFQDKLSVQGPKRIETRLQQATRESLKEAFIRLQQATSAEIDDNNRAAYFARVLRELDRRSQELSERIGVERLQLDTVSSITSALYLRMAELVADSATQKLETSVARKQFTPVELWGGSPALPTQPLPHTFGFLISLQRAMTDIGEDVWVRDAVRVLKEHLNEKLVPVLEFHASMPVVNGEIANGESEPKEDGEEGDKDEGEGEEVEVEAAMEEKEKAKSSTEQQQLVQRLFDASYLANVLSTSGSSGFQHVVGGLKQETALDDALALRIEKGAAEYWKRTHLLFGLLAGTNNASRDSAAKR